MSQDVLFKDDRGIPLETKSFLRNGSVITSGVRIEDFGLGEATIAALTSRGNKASGGIMVRQEALPDMIEALIRLSHEMNPGNDQKVRRRVEAALTELDLEREDVVAMARNL